MLGIKGKCKVYADVNHLRAPHPEHMLMHSHPSQGF